MAGAINKMIRSYFAVYFVCVIGFVSAENEETISLSNVNPTQMNSELYSDFRLFNKTNSGLHIQLTDISSSIAFIIVQAHSYQYNVTLSYTSALNKEHSLSGTNVGLYFDISTSATPSFYVFSENPDYSVQWYLSIHGFDKNAPIPGGCNMEFPILITPQLNLRYTSDVIFVEAAQAQMSLAKPSCERAIMNITHDFYRLYMAERDYSSDGYFSNIRKMITVESVLKHGSYIPPHTGYAQLRRTFSLYKGIGSVYAVLAWRGNQVSIYVPAQTYGHPFSDNLTDISTSTMIMYGFIITMGFFICYFGHFFFMTEMFFLGLCSGGIITYICLSLMMSSASDSLIIASLISGICFGVIWWMVWWFWGIPVLSTLLASLTLGFLMASLVFFSLPDGIQLLEYSANYSAVFICITLAVSCITTCTTYMGNIIACAVLGSYAIVYVLDHYIGSNLKYILVNTIRRATIAEFSAAIVSPPFQWRDILVSILWIALCLTGILIQRALQKRRPPFPPPPRQSPSRSRDNRSRNRRDYYRPSAPSFYQTFPIVAAAANVIPRNITDPGIGYLQGSSERPTNERTPLVFGRREQV